MSIIANHTLPEVLRHERAQKAYVQGSSEMREIIQDISNRLSEVLLFTIRRPILHRVTVEVTSFISMPVLDPGSYDGQSNPTLVPGVRLSKNGGSLCPGIFLLDDTHATAYSYGPSISTGFIVLHTSLLHELGPEKTAFTSTTNRHLVAFMIAHELGHLLLHHHLESISQMLFYPSLGAVLVDFFRSILYPLFIMFGPFVEEGMRAMGRVTIAEGRELVHLCFNRTMEIEADSIALRSVARTK